MTQSIFEFHTGFKIYNDDPEQSVMDCPFCGKDQKFWFNRDGQYHCKSGSCNASGNAFTFIRKLYDQFDNVTRTAELVRDLRGIPTEWTRANKLKFNDYNGSILIPCFKHDVVQALYKACSERVFDVATGTIKEKWRIFACPKQGGIEHALMHWPEVTNDIVWIVEGHWDKLAADAIIGHTHPVTAIAVPPVCK